MKSVSFAECAADAAQVDAIVEAHLKYGCSDENETPEGVFVVPLAQDARSLKWRVVDNRSRMGFIEDFATLDGALSYATDGHVQTGDQCLWDRDGKFHDELLERCRTFDGPPDELSPCAPGSVDFAEAARRRAKKWAEDERETFDALRDRFVTSMDESDDVDALKRAFADSVVRDVNGVHEFAVARGADGVPRVTAAFHNEVGQTCAVDGILEGFNMADWRSVCDAIVARALRTGGKDPEDFDWPAPDVRVTYRANPDEDDVVKSVELEWAVDEDTFEALADAMAVVKSTQAALRADAEESRRKDKESQEKDKEENDEGKRPYEVVELCPECDREAAFRWDVDEDGYAAHCPHCGKRLLLCDECSHADDNKDRRCDCHNGECFRTRAKAHGGVGA